VERVTGKLTPSPNKHNQQTINIYIVQSKPAPVLVLETRANQGAALISGSCLFVDSFCPVVMVCLAL